MKHYWINCSNLYLAILTLMMLLMIPELGVAKCKNMNWASVYIEEQFSEKDNNRLIKFYNETPIFVRAKVVEQSSTIKNLLKSKSKKPYRFTATVMKSLKNAPPEGAKLSFSYKWKLSKPRVESPQLNEEWIFALSEINSGVATPRGTGCGLLGFPVSQKKILSAFMRIHKNK